MNPEEKFFYDPHPGCAGASIPIPKTVKIIAQILENTQTTVAIAMQLIQTACPSGSVIDSGDVLVLRLKLDEQIHRWRVIRYKEIK